MLCQAKISSVIPVPVRLTDSFLTLSTVRARTGSGKTAAYLLPLLQSTLKRKTQPGSTKCISALILVPTRELASQVTKELKSFTAFCAQDVRTENLTRKEDDKVQRTRLLDVPDIIVATPSRVNTLVEASVLDLQKLLHLVIDEADLILSYGHDEDLKSLAKSIPTGVQTVLMSATLRADVDQLKGLFCKQPEILALDDAENEAESKLSQYVIKCGEDEKFLLIYAIFMLKLVKGKSIVFVADIDRCYRLKLFLEQFGIRSCVLNSELPVNSRIHVVEEFNRGVYDIIIASDDQEVVGSDEKARKRRKKNTKADEEQPEAVEAEAEAEPETETQDTPTTTSKKDKPRKRTKQDAEYGISRGIDFKNVACVFNFDLPTSSQSYTHRTGRTARAGKNGMALSFVVPKALYRKHKPTTIATAEHDEAVLAAISSDQAAAKRELKPYDFDMARLEGFRYRVSDAMRGVTRIAVRDARARELRNELLKSEKLKRHFEENPDDMYHLRHDQETRAVRVQPHLKHVPEYLMPGGAIKRGETGFVGFKKTTENGLRKSRALKRSGGRGKKSGGKGSDPLKSLRGKK